MYLSHTLLTLKVPLTLDQVGSVWVWVGIEGEWSNWRSGRIGLSPSHLWSSVKKFPTLNECASSMKIVHIQEKEIIRGVVHAAFLKECVGLILESGLAHALGNFF